MPHAHAQCPPCTLRSATPHSLTPLLRANVPAVLLMPGDTIAREPAKGLWLEGSVEHMPPTDRRMSLPRIGMPQPLGAPLLPRPQSRRTQKGVDPSTSHAERQASEEAGGELRCVPTTSRSTALCG